MKYSTPILVILILLLGLFTSPVHAKFQPDENQEWISIVQKGYELQNKYSKHPSTYKEMRKAFTEVFTVSCMIDLFIEHLQVVDEGYQIGGSDFSPYLIPAPEFLSLSVVEGNENKMTLIEDVNPEGNELFGPKHTQKRIQLINTREGWKIDHMQWIPLPR